MIITGIICLALLAVIFIAWKSVSPMKGILKSVSQMKQTGDAIQAQMNDIKNQQTLLQEKKEFLRWDILQKKNSLIKVKEAVQETKTLLTRVK